MGGSAAGVLSSAVTGVSAAAAGAAEWFEWRSKGTVWSRPGRKNTGKMRAEISTRWQRIDVEVV